MQSLKIVERNVICMFQAGFGFAFEKSSAVYGRAQGSKNERRIWIKITFFMAKKRIKNRLFEFPQNFLLRFRFSFPFCLFDRWRRSAQVGRLIRFLHNDSSESHFSSQPFVVIINNNSGFYCKARRDIRSKGPTATG